MSGNINNNAQVLNIIEDESILDIFLKNYTVNLGSKEIKIPQGLLRTIIFIYKNPK